MATFFTHIKPDAEEPYPVTATDHAPQEVFVTIFMNILQNVIIGRNDVYIGKFCRCLC